VEDRSLRREPLATTYENKARKELYAEH
jgi:hypothetical protein